MPLCEPWKSIADNLVLIWSQGQVTWQFLSCNTYMVSIRSYSLFVGLLPFVLLSELYVGLVSNLHFIFALCRLNQDSTWGLCLLTSCYKYISSAAEEYNLPFYPHFNLTLCIRVEYKVLHSSDGQPISLIAVAALSTILATIALQYPKRSLKGSLVCREVLQWDWLISVC